MTCRQRHASVPVIVALLLGGYACSRPPETGAVKTNRWDSFVSGFLDQYFAFRPDQAVNAGRHEFDGRLPDWSAEGLATFGAFLKDQRAKAVAFDLTGVDARGFERDYLVARIDRDLWWLETADGPHRNPTFYTDALDPDPYLTRPYAPLEKRMRAYAAYARAVPAAAAHIRQNLKGPLPRTFIDRARGAFGGFADFFRSDVPAVFAAVTDSALKTEFAQANDGAMKAMRDLDAYFETLRPTQTESFALGADLFKRMLYQIERVDTPLEELERIGRADLERNVAALGMECAAYAPGRGLQDCMKKMDGHKPPEPTPPAARRQLATLRQFIIDKNIVAIPGTEEAKVGESPPYMRWNFAYIMIPGPYETNMPSTYYVAPPDKTWTPAEQAEYIPGEANLLFTSAHEVWPGHFLQFLHANRSPSKFGRVFVGYAFAEGWAHYAEELMWESGLGNGDAETHIGQLSNALLRNGRFLSAIGLHTRGWTVAQSEAFFHDHAYQDAATSKQQAARGTFDPEYLDYTLGKLMIRKLRADWDATRGGQASWKGFHDAFLAYGGPPIPMIRTAMLGAAGSLF